MFSRSILVESDSYHPLAGSGQCVIRQFSGKYNGIGVGDDVIIRHCSDISLTDLPHATELLRVSAVAVGNLDDLVDCHGHKFHIKDDITNYHFDGTDDIRNYIRGFYPVYTDEDENPIDDSSQMYLAIYF